MKPTPQHNFEINQLNNLKIWSGLNNINVIFDSDLDGNGFHNVLCQKVINKKNLFFISIDFNGNVFGGYLTTTINTIYDWIKDEKAFVCSILRNGNIKNIKYTINKENKAFILYPDNNYDTLYEFGCDGDVGIKKIGSKSSFCQQISYNYSNELNALVDNNYPERFAVQRIMVIEMN